MVDDNGDFHDVYRNEVRLAETDATGVLFFGEYTIYLDETLIAYLAELGFDWERMDKTDWDLAIVNVEIDYRSYTQLGDEIINSFRVESLGDRSITGEYRARTAETNEVTAEGNLTAAFIDEDTKETIPVPQELLDAVKEYQGTT